MKTNILRLFSGSPSLDSQQVRKVLNSAEISFNGSLELASGASVSFKSMGNWQRLYRDEKNERGYCPHLGKEFGILSNGNIVFCHLDYDGKTAFANAKDGELKDIFQNPKIQQEINKFCTEGIIPKGCQYCIIPYKYSSKTISNH